MKRYDYVYGAGACTVISSQAVEYHAPGIALTDGVAPRLFPYLVSPVSATLLSIVTIFLSKIGGPDTP